MKQASRAALGTPTARGSISESRSKAGGTLADAVKAKLRAKGDEAFHKMKKMFLGAIEKLGGRAAWARVVRPLSRAGLC
jgi:hypothetical protein